MYVWKGRGVLQCGSVVAGKGDEIPKGVSASELEAMLKDGRIKKVSAKVKTDVDKAEVALEKAEAAVVKAKAALELVPDNKKKVVGEQLKEKEEAVVKAQAVLEEAIEDASS